MRNPQAVSNFYEENLNNFRSEIHATIPSVSKRVSTGPILLSRISSFPPRSIYGREWFLQITLMIVMVQHPSASQFVRCSAKGHTLIQALHPSFSNRDPIIQQNLHFHHQIDRIRCNPTTPRPHIDIFQSEADCCWFNSFASYYIKNGTQSASISIKKNKKEGSIFFIQKHNRTGWPNRRF